MPPEDLRAGLLRVETHHHDDRYVICPHGEVDLSTVEQLRTALQRAEATDAKRIVIDLSVVTFMDSAGLHLLLDAQQRASQDSSRLRLVPGPRPVQRVFELTDTEGQLPFFE